MLTTPRSGGQPLNPAVAVAAEIAGVDALYQVGGVPAIGALAYGTESIPRVDKICGPGNIFVAYAKKLVQGAVDIDGVFGPTETIILADGQANPEFCAADLIAQAEHDPLATAILVTDSEELVSRIGQQLERQLNRRAPGRNRPGSRWNGRAGWCWWIRWMRRWRWSTASPRNIFCLLLQDPWEWAPRIRHAGGLFLGGVFAGSDGRLYRPAPAM